MFQTELVVLTQFLIGSVINDYSNRSDNAKKQLSNCLNEENSSQVSCVFA